MNHRRSEAPPLLEPDEIAPKPLPAASSDRRVELARGINVAQTFLKKVRHELTEEEALEADLRAMDREREERDKSTRVDSARRGEL